MKDLKIVITDYQYADIENEGRIAREAGIFLKSYHCKTQEEVIDVVKDADAVIVQYADMNADVISHMKHCQVIIKYGIGVNNIDVKAATEKGIYVCNVPDYGVDEVANHAVTMLLALAKKLPTITKALRNGDWSYDSIIPLFRLAGSTLGLIGLGRIPLSVAKKMASFDVKILAYDPFIDAKIAEENNVTLVDFETLCKESDFISVHCPLTAATTHLINKKAFQMMKKTAIVINTARGPVICEKDLIDALEQGEIAGAGIDVFETEPVSIDNKLLKMENVIATPHIAWYSEEAIQSVQSKAAQEAVNVLSGNCPLNPVNKLKIVKA